MKTIQANKVIAITVALSLAFFQIVPAGLAAGKTNPSDLTAQTGVSGSVDPLAKTQVTTPAVIPANFLMHTGGITKATPTTIPTAATVATNLSSRIPATIRDYVTKVQALGFKVEVSAIAKTQPPQYIVKMTDTKNYAVTPVGNVKSASITLFADSTGTLQVLTEKITVTCYSAKGGDTQVNGELLYEGLRQISAQPAFTMLQVKVSNSTTSGMMVTYQGYQYTIQQSKDKKVTTVTPMMPLAVTNHITSLQNAATGYTVTAAYIPGTHPPQYQVDVSDNKAYYVAPVGPLYAMSYILRGDGIVDSKSVSAAYYGIQDDAKVVGPLLYEAMGVCPEGQICKMVATSPIDLLKTLTTISVTKVETSPIYTVHFTTTDGKYYKTYRDAAGKVIVIDEVEALRAQIMASTTAEIVKVMAELADHEAKLALQLAEWEKNVTQLKADLAAGRGNADAISGAVTSYLDQAGVSDALKNEIQGYLTRSGSLLDGLNAAEEQYAAFLKTGARTTGLAIDNAKAYLAALQNHEGKVSAAKTTEELALLTDLPARRARMPKTVMPPPVEDPRLALNALVEEGKLLKEKLEALPPLAVRVFSAQLNTLLNPAGAKSFNITEPALQADGTYLVTVSDDISHLITPTSGFEKMSFNVDVTGKLIPASLDASYYGIKQVVDGQLLYEGMKLMEETGTPEGAEVRVLARMAAVSVIAVVGDAISFSLTGKYYKIFRDANEQVKLEAVQTPVTPKISDQPTGNPEPPPAPPESSVDVATMPFGDGAVAIVKITDFPSNNVSYFAKIRDTNGVVIKQYQIDRGDYTPSVSNSSYGTYYTLAFKTVDGTRVTVQQLSTSTPSSTIDEMTVVNFTGIGDVYVTQSYSLSPQGQWVETSYSPSYFKTESVWSSRYSSLVSVQSTYVMGPNGLVVRNKSIYPYSYPGGVFTYPFIQEITYVNGVAARASIYGSNATSPANYLYFDGSKVSVTLASGARQDYLLSSPSIVEDSEGFVTISADTTVNGKNYKIQFDNAGEITLYEYPVFGISASTKLGGAANLWVNVGGDGNATVVLDGNTYAGIFDPVTRSVFLSIPVTGDVPAREIFFDFENVDGVYSLVSLWDATLYSASLESDHVYMFRRGEVVQTVETEEYYWYLYTNSVLEGQVLPLGAYKYVDSITGRNVSGSILLVSSGDIALPPPTLPDQENLQIVPDPSGEGYQIEGSGVMAGESYEITGHASGTDPEMIGILLTFRDAQGRVDREVMEMRRRSDASSEVNYNEIIYSLPTDMTFEARPATVPSPGTISQDYSGNVPVSTCAICTISTEIHVAGGFWDPVDDSVPKHSRLPFGMRNPLTPEQRRAGREEFYKLPLRVVAGPVVTVVEACQAVKSGYKQAASFFMSVLKEAVQSPTLIP